MYSTIGAGAFVNARYWKQNVAAIIEYLSEEEKCDTIEYEELIEAVRRRYKSMFTPRSGLGEFHIWNENFEIRHKANCEYEKIKKQIEEIIIANK